MHKKLKSEIDEKLATVAEVICFLGSASQSFLEANKGAFLDETIVGMMKTYDWVNGQIKQIGELVDVIDATGGKKP